MAVGRADDAPQGPGDAAQARIRLNVTTDPTDAGQELTAQLTRRLGRYAPQVTVVKTAPAHDEPVRWSTQVRHVEATTAHLEIAHLNKTLQDQARPFIDQLKKDYPGLAVSEVVLH